MSDSAVIVDHGSIACGRRRLRPAEIGGLRFAGRAVLRRILATDRSLYRSGIQHIALSHTQVCVFGPNLHRIPRKRCHEVTLRECLLYQCPPGTACSSEYEDVHVVSLVVIIFSRRVDNTPR